MADQVSACPPEFRVSVVVPTYNRRQMLRDTIESLFRQTLASSEFEILIVDDGSTDDTAEMIAGLRERSPVPLLYHRMPENRGVAQARNTAVRLARGRIIAFTDSDCIVHPAWLERGLAAFRPGVAFVSGPVLDKPGQHVSFFSRTNYSGHGHNPTYPACNIMYRRDVYLQMGGNDETLSFGKLGTMSVECADTDLAWRVKDKGYETVFLPDLLVYHEVERLQFRRWLLYPFRLFAVPALVKRHPHLRPMLLTHRVFFLKESPANYLALAGGVAALGFHPAFALLAAPYLYRLSRALHWELSLVRIPKALAQLVLVSLQQCVATAGLVYGSVRFRSLVL
ncbi:MAG: glycosyltransferase [Acidobacteria bacterium]|nr:glycosyltransferase [Acidobacteriota bacterium]